MNTSAPPSPLSYDDLLAHALVGTERRPYPDAALLAHAAVTGARRNAGYMAARYDGPDPEPTPLDATGRAPSSRAEQILELLVHQAVWLHGAEPAVLEQWLIRAAAARIRPPHHLLPELLDLATRQPDLRDATRAAIGPRGAWLAAHENGWSWVAPAPDDLAHFPTARRAERIAMLAALRARDTTSARELLASTWTRESAADRAALLDTFTGTVAPDDEPFLEAALDDRSRHVRAVAARLLDALPGSARAQRMAARVRPLVTMSGRMKRQLAVELPDHIDDDARRDGIDDSAPPKVGLRSWWFIQLVAATPLSMWEERGAPPELVALAANEPELVDGWVGAAIAQHDRRWARALFDDVLDPELLAVLDAPAAQETAGGALDRVVDKKLADVLEAVATPWSPDFSALVGDRVARARSRGDRLTMILAAGLDPTTGGVPGLPALDRALELRRIIDEELR